MKTHCNQKTFEFQTENSRKVMAHFNGGNISSDSGGLLLQQTERITSIILQFAGCFTDHRDPDLSEHAVKELIAQRIYALALGYEDLNDHDELRNDPLFAVISSFLSRCMKISGGFAQYRCDVDSLSVVPNQFFQQKLKNTRGGTHLSRVARGKMP